MRCLGFAPRSHSTTAYFNKQKAKLNIYIFLKQGLLTQGHLLPFMRIASKQLASPCSRSAFQTAACTETTAIFYSSYFKQQRKRRSAAVQPGSRPAHEAAGLCPTCLEEVTWGTSRPRRTTRVSGAAAGGGGKAVRRGFGRESREEGVWVRAALPALWAMRWSAVGSPSPHPSCGYRSNKDSPPPSPAYGSAFRNNWRCKIPFKTQLGVEQVAFALKHCMRLRCA